MFDDFFIIWILIELQIIIFISIALRISDKTLFGVTIYFLVQRSASLSLLFVFIIKGASFLLSLLFILKLGVFPLVNWYSFCVSLMPDFLAVYALTFQKLPSLILCRVFFSDYGFDSRSSLIIISSLNIMYCSWVSLGCSSDKECFVWLRIASTFWNLLLVLESYSIFLLYFMVYRCFVVLFFNSNLSFNRFFKTLSLLNFSSLPPLPEFFFKVYIISLVFSVYSCFEFLGFVVLLSLVFSVVYSLSFSYMIIKSLIYECFSN